MPLSPHQACYYAHELTRLGAVGEMDRLSTTLFDSKVDLNPHQVEAALFAISNPLQKGVILADEVGLSYVWPFRSLVTRTIDADSG